MNCSFALKVAPVLALVLLMAGSFAHAGQKTNCRLVIHTLYESGKKLVEVDETATASRDECKAEAKLRELNSSTGVDVVKVTVVFAYRGPSVIQDAD